MEYRYLRADSLQTESPLAPLAWQDLVRSPGCPQPRSLGNGDVQGGHRAEPSQ